MYQRLDFHGSLILSYAISVIAIRIFLEIFKTRIKYLRRELTLEGLALKLRYLSNTISTVKLESKLSGKRSRIPRNASALGTIGTEI